MSFFKKLGKAFKKIIGVVAAVAAAVFIPGAGAFIGKALLGAAISIGASKLLAKRAEGNAPAGADAGGRVQLPPATDNKLPVIYGSAWVGGPITDAKISQDQKYMWYVIAFAEKTSTSYSYDLANGVYYDGKLVQFGSNGVVTGLITNNSGLGTAQVDTRMNGKIYIWLFTNGSSSGVNTGGQSAITIMSDSTTGGGIYPSELRWNGSLFTDGGQSPTMTDTAFAIVRVEYNPDAGTTGLGSLQVKLTNNMGSSFGAEPGDVILDYLQNTRYGCAIPLEYIDIPSLNLLNAYSNEQIEYVAVNDLTQIQPYRYRVNGVINTAASCLTNLQTMVDSCDSWLQYSEATGKWRVVMNAPYAGPLNQLFLADSNNIIGGVQINPVDLNETYNQVEVAYPNVNIKDQSDYQVIDLTNPANWSNDNFDDILSPNEATNRLNISLPLVNNAVQAKYLAARRLLQSREDLVISCDLDYSGIQIEAGDVIRVGQPDYGWGPISTDPANPYKLFRVSTVNEQTLEDGSLVASIEAFEYNNTVYADNAIRDFIPADNTGLSDPNVISPPCIPMITDLPDTDTNIDSFKVESCVPDFGTVLYMDFNYGNNSNVQTHQLYRTVQSAGGIPFQNSDSANGYFNTISVTVNDLPANVYYWSATARNDTAGRVSDGSAAYTYGGTNVKPFNPDTTRGGLSGNQYKPNSVSYTTINNTIVALSPIKSYFYTVSDSVANIVYTPVDATTLANVATANFAQPKYLDVNYSGTDDYYPYYNGTSSTTNGWQANSTAQFQPARADQLVIVNGDLDWQVLEFVILPTPISTSETAIYDWEVQLVSDIDCEIQFGACTSFTSNVEIILGRGSFLQTSFLKAGEPQTIDYEVQLKGSDSILGCGILARNFTAGARIDTMRGRFTVFKRKT